MALLWYGPAPHSVGQLVPRGYVAPPPIAGPPFARLTPAGRRVQVGVVSPGGRSLGELALGIARYVALGAGAYFSGFALGLAPGFVLPGIMTYVVGGIFGIATSRQLGIDLPGIPLWLRAPAASLLIGPAVWLGFGHGAKSAILRHWRGGGGLFVDPYQVYRGWGGGGGQPW